MLTIVTSICLWIVVTTGSALWLIPLESINTLIMSLFFFNNLNILIALCEIALGVHIMFIKEDYRKLKEQYKGREVQACVAYLTMPLPNPFDSKAWSKMWSTYSLYDPSYQNHESFGFFIDFGNGISTIPPCLLWNYALVFPDSVSSLLVGCVGIAMYWQILYGTVVYLLSFVYNGRYRGKGLAEVLGFVGVSNSIWFIFPILGIYASVCVLRDGDMSIVRS